LSSLFVEKHLRKLQACNDTYAWEGKKIRDFAQSLLKRDLKRDGVNPQVVKIFGEIETFPEKPLSKPELRDFISGDHNLLQKVVAIFAWGGMKVHHCASLLKTYHSDWERIASKMASGQLSRFDAYEQFHQARLNGKLKGMGPAYFTKLIFFLEQSHTGYIMDQWTARSMNLLRASNENEIVLVKNYSKRGKDGSLPPLGYRVDPKKNDVNIYRAFCEDLEALAEVINPELPPIERNLETEMLIFSKGQNGKEERGDWRKYVIENG